MLLVYISPGPFMLVGCKQDKTELTQPADKVETTTQSTKRFLIIVREREREREAVTVYAIIPNYYGREANLDRPRDDWMHHDLIGVARTVKCYVEENPSDAIIVVCLSGKLFAKVKVKLRALSNDEITSLRSLLPSDVQFDLRQSVE
ncbi:hypothetical protein [Schlesneria paludicola]|uniref:hypothetical protein n=1 Tax=Schlesneria paludicola TaxID=360056 RepID=UPI00029B1CEB|nr:hypothetical protein [Schlesneria paludicola]